MKIYGLSFLLLFLFSFVGKLYGAFVGQVDIVRVDLLN